MPTKKPQDHKASHKDPFTFEHDGQQHQIKSLARLKMGLLEDLAGLDDTMQVFTLIKACADQDAHEAIRDMERDEFQDFMAAWREHSGVSEGEF